MKITPAHDPNDFLTGKRHSLEFINVLDDNGGWAGGRAGRWWAACWPTFPPSTLSCQVRSFHASATSASATSAGNINGNGTGQFAGQPRFKARRGCAVGCSAMQLSHARCLGQQEGGEQGKASSVLAQP